MITCFYQVPGNILVNSKAQVDKFKGDEVSPYFVPGLVGKDYARIALEIGKEILKRTGHNSAEGPWAPVGVGIHSGPAIVGALGKEGGLNDITVLGDTANTAASWHPSPKPERSLPAKRLSRKLGLIRPV